MKKIFISYASEQKSIAEEISLALRSEGYKVFIDKEILSAGQEYHNKLRKAISDADKVIFLISPQSLEIGKYTLSELSLIQERWSHPRGRVLPVMVVPCDFKKIPAYLKDVTILSPQGNIQAEVLAALEIMRKDSLKPWRIWSIISTVFVVPVVILLTWTMIELNFGNKAMAKSWLIRAHKEDCSVYDDSFGFLEGDVNLDGENDLVVLYTLEECKSKWGRGSNMWEQMLAIFVSKGGALSFETELVVGGRGIIPAHTVHLSEVVNGEIYLQALEQYDDDPPNFPSKPSVIACRYSANKIICAPK